MSRVHFALRLSPFKISAGYLVFGVVWIPTTDIIVATAFESQTMPALPGLIKGWTLVGLSAVLIYSLSRVHRQQMASTQERLQTANQQLQVIHRVFRHNIRNDLNVVMGYADILSDRISNAQLKSYAERIRHTSQRVVDISEKLKIVERIDSPLSNETSVDLVDVVNSEVERLRERRPGATVFTEHPSSAWIQGDSSLQYAIREVLDNAIEHNDKPERECEISVRIERDSTEYEVLVSDNGPGIPEGELQALDREQETPLVHASSVGLWNVTWLSRMHGGSVAFDADDGTTVRFRFQADPYTSLLDTKSVKKASFSPV